MPKRKRNERTAAEIRFTDGSMKLCFPLCQDKHVLSKDERARLCRLARQYLESREPVDPSSVPADPNAGPQETVVWENFPDVDESDCFKTDWGEEF
jgi:hypothetical protein